ncbi:antA/AntB antirepressor family protein [Campylobacter gastrosuis]|uniref:AntA/AntB antirepressor family protein n=1 Tax=Campylobacter gastrosuis TaxID=2974576 RepID=A0ABT7HT08_9BACT|nr:antA/AntB antirepressor family protein [Campylobacter gastrosuis]MDL0090000.1 antA/AntB antirepressor family protein [Campylobacter gastrosuis]
MNELIPIGKTKLNGAEINSVNARDLHEVLESKYQFADWIKTRLDEVDAIENIDYIIVSEKSETMSEAGRKASIKKEYILTIDIAKEISMLERNEIGKKVRRYFIEVEKAYKAQFAIPKNLSEALRLAADQAEQIEALEAQRIASLPYVTYAKAVEASATSALIGDFIKTLCDENNVSVGRNRIFKWLRDEKYLMSDNMPYQKWLDAGYFEVTPQIIVTPKGNKERFTTRISAKGQVALSAKICEVFKRKVA